MRSVERTKSCKGEGGDDNSQVLRGEIRNETWLGDVKNYLTDFE